MYDLILKNCTVINENKSFESDIAIKNNRIELISNSIDQESKEIIDIDGRFIIPGLIMSLIQISEPTRPN